MAHHTRDAAIAFAHFIRGLGFRVYLAKCSTYGFITDDSEVRVLSFSFTDGGSLGGNYSPPSTQSGTGWRMDGHPSDLRTADQVRTALYAVPPPWAGRGWKRPSTVADYLGLFGASSGFKAID